MQIESHETSPNAVAVISVGGNDALAYEHLLLGEVPPMVPSELLADLHGIRENFRSVYNRALDACKSRVWCDRTEAFA